MMQMLDECNQELTVSLHHEDLAQRTQYVERHSWKIDTMLETIGCWVNKLKCFCSPHNSLLMSRIPLPYMEGNQCWRIMSISWTGLTTIATSLSPLNLMPSRTWSTSFQPCQSIASQDRTTKVICCMFWAERRERRYLRYDASWCMRSMRTVSLRIFGLNSTLMVSFVGNPSGGSFISQT